MIMDMVVVVIAMMMEVFIRMLFHTKVVMRPIMVMTKSRVLQVTLLNLMKIAKWK